MATSGVGFSVRILVRACMDEARAHLERARRNLRRRLTSGEKLAIDGYANLVRPACGFVMNRLLRGLPPRADKESVETAQAFITDMDAVMQKAYTFPCHGVDTVYRGVSKIEVSRWKVGDAREFKGFMSTSVVPARARLYNHCCVIVVKGSVDAPVKYVYSPNEEEVILNRGTKLRLKSKRNVRTSPTFWKHPDHPLEDHPPFGETITVYEAVTT